MSSFKYRLNGVYQKLSDYNDTRQFWLILTYKFGNQNIETRSMKRVIKKSKIGYKLSVLTPVKQ